MNIREFSKYYLFSPAGAASAFIAAAVGVIAGILSNILLGAVSGASALLAIFLLALFSGFGSRFAVGEKNRRIWLTERGLLEKVRLAQARLGSMRIADPSIKRLAETAALRAGEYYSACIRQKTHDPRATFAAGECLELLDVYLTELDESSTEKRFGMTDANPFADANERISAALNERIALLGKCAQDVQGGLSSSDKLEIKEQL